MEPLAAGLFLPFLLIEGEPRLLLTDREVKSLLASDDDHGMGASSFCFAPGSAPIRRQKGAAPPVFQGFRPERAFVCLSELSIDLVGARHRRNLKNEIAAGRAVDNP
jgi:hypothetical protein